MKRKPTRPITPPDPAVKYLQRSDYYGITWAPQHVPHEEESVELKPDFSLEDIDRTIQELQRLVARGTE